MEQFSFHGCRQVQIAKRPARSHTACWFDHWKIDSRIQEFDSTIVVRQLFDLHIDVLVPGGFALQHMDLQEAILEFGSYLRGIRALRQAEAAGKAAV
jgi:hypothetical protein